MCRRSYPSRTQASKNISTPINAPDVTHRGKQPDNHVPVINDSHQAHRHPAAQYECLHVQGIVLFPPGAFQAGAVQAICYIFSVISQTPPWILSFTHSRDT